MVDRIASFTQTSQLINNNLRLQGKYSEGQVQLSSGLKSDGYQGIAPDSSRLLNLETDYDRITQQSENTQIALDRGEIMYSAMGGILDTARQFIQDLNTTISGFGLTDTDLANNARTNMNLIVGALNTNMADRFLFGGSDTKTAPVNLAGYGGQTFVAPGPSVADTTYYQGNDYIHSVEAADGFVINYGINADNPAFEKMFRAFDLIITNPTDYDTMLEAALLLNQAYDDTAVLQASLSQSVQTMDRQLDNNLEEINLIDNQIVDIREIDGAEVSIRLKQLEAQLEASYSVTTKLMNLSLVDFIR